MPPGASYALHEEGIGGALRAASLDAGATHAVALAAELAETSIVRDAEWLVALDAEERQGPAPWPEDPTVLTPRTRPRPA